MMNSPKINVQIIAKDVEDLNTLRKFLDEHSSIVISQTSTNVKDGYANVINESVDLIFVDIEIQNNEDIDILKELHKYSPKTKTVIISNTKDFAVTAIQKSAFDYIVKPIDKLEIDRIILKYLDASENEFNLELNSLSKNKSKFVFRTHHGLEIIDLTKVLYIEADKNYSTFYMEQNGKKVCCYNIGKLDPVLMENNFKRISRKHIINLDKLDSIDTKKRTCLILNDGEEIRLKYTITVSEIMKLLGSFIL